MVRIKHRYLLVQILYPGAASIQDPKRSNVLPGPAKAATDNAALPASLQYHAPTPDSVTLQDVLRLLRQQLLDLFGEHGAGVAAGGLAIKYWSNATSTFIIRCPRSCESMVWACITYATHLKAGGSQGDTDRRVYKDRRAAPDRQKDSFEVVMKVARVSGTIKKCQEEAIFLARALCGRAKGLALALDEGLLLDDGDNDWYGDDDDAANGSAAKPNKSDDESDVSMVEGLNITDGSESDNGGSDDDNV